MDIPTGTVTFLVSDIERSSELWERNEQAMSAAVARHDQLMRQAMDANRGYVFKSLGDGFCVAFARPDEAVNAALAAQLSLFAEPWKEGSEIRVRMGLHAGVAELRDGDYFGPPVNRISRISSIAHGGQVLISQTVHDLLREVLPAGASLRDMGEHRLRDLARPERLFQLSYPTLPSEFPALRSSSNQCVPNNLPRQSTTFIGRENEMAEARRLLQEHRLLTVTGAGGVGKSRFALQLVPEIMEDFPDGVWFVEFASIAEPSAVPALVARVLSQRDDTARAPTELLVAALKDKRVLLLFDNCEHVLSEVAQLADRLLKACSHVQILATSRAVLNIAGEQRYRLPSLSRPALDVSVDISSLGASESVRLFVDRARMVRREFFVTEENARCLVSICNRVDGIPLAIELAAARAGSLNLDEIDARLDDMFAVLSGGSRGSLPRHQTLKSTIDWSHDLLDGNERGLLYRLSVFVNGCTMEAAESICGGESIAQPVLDVLTRLCDWSIVTLEPPSGPSRYRLLEPVRQYALEKLELSGFDAEMRRRHRDWFLDLAQEAEPYLTGFESARWFGTLEAELGNLRAAMEWSLATAGELPPALKFGIALHRFWVDRGHWVEGRDYLAKALEKAETSAAEAEPSLRLQALIVLSSLAFMSEDYDGAAVMLEKAEKRARELGDTAALANVLNGQGNLSNATGNPQKARCQLLAALELNRSLPQGGTSHANLSNLGLICLVQGDYEASERYLTEAISLARLAGNASSEAVCLFRTAPVMRDRLDFKAAQDRMDEVLSMVRKLGLRWWESEALLLCAELAWDQGQFEDARDRLLATLELAKEIGHDAMKTRALALLVYVYAELGEMAQARETYRLACQALDAEGDGKFGREMFLSVSELLLKCGDLERATILLATAVKVREAHPEVVHSYERRRFEFVKEALRAKMTEGAFEAAWAWGLAMSAADAEALARASLH